MCFWGILAAKNDLAEAALKNSDTALRAVLQFIDEDYVILDGDSTLS